MRRRDVRSLVARFFEILSNAVKASFFGLMNHNACWRTALFGKAKAAVADATTWRTYPSAVQERLTCALPIPVTQARTTELSPYTDAILIVTNCLLVESLLSALVASRAINFVIGLAFHALGNLFYVDRIAVKAIQFNGQGCGFSGTEAPTPDSARIRVSLEVLVVFEPFD